MFAEKIHMMIISWFIIIRVPVVIMVMVVAQVRDDVAYSDSAPLCPEYPCFSIFTPTIRHTVTFAHPHPLTHSLSLSPIPLKLAPAPPVTLLCFSLSILTYFFTSLPLIPQAHVSSLTPLLDYRIVFTWWLFSVRPPRGLCTYFTSYFPLVLWHASSHPGSPPSHPLNVFFPTLSLTPPTRPSTFSHQLVSDTYGYTWFCSRLTTEKPIQYVKHAQLLSMCIIS